MKYNQIEINNLLKTAWTYTNGKDSEIGFTKKSLEHFYEFSKHLSGIALETLTYESNGFGGIASQYKIHVKYDDYNSIVKILIDFGDNLFSYCKIENNQLVEKASFKNYSEILNIIPLK